jgi:anaerobic selenocysteine-containing dehydrogenase
MTDIDGTKKVTCLFCASRCGMLLHTWEGRVVRIQGDPDNPVSRGWTCSRGRAAVVESLQSTAKLK